MFCDFVYHCLIYVKHSNHLIANATRNRKMYTRHYRKREKTEKNIQRISNMKINLK